MLKKLIKSMLIFTISAGALAAAPANAGTMITYYGQVATGIYGIVGYKLYCDSGALYQEGGGVSDVYETTFLSLPC